MVASEHAQQYGQRRDMDGVNHRGSKSPLYGCLISQSAGRKTRPSAASHTPFGLASGWGCQDRSFSRGGKILDIFPSRLSYLPSAYRSERVEGVPTPPGGSSPQRRSDPDTFETLLPPPCPDATTNRPGHGYRRDRASRRPRIEEGACLVLQCCLEAFDGLRRIFAIDLD